jgi:ribosomal protein S18 acetylase RimI-like enzyme
MLFATAENWLTERHCSGVLGPMGFTDIDEQGLLVEGFDEPGTLPVIYCHPYYRTHIEALGYVKRIDWLEHRLEVPPAVPGKVLRAAEFVREMMPEIRVLNAKKSKEFKPYINKVFDLLNVAYKDLFGTTEFTPEQIKYYSKMYFSLLHPAFTKLAIDPDDRVVGLIVAMPSLTKAFQKMRGHLFPFGFLSVLRALKKNDEVDIYLAAIHPEYDNSGLVAVMITDFIESLIGHGVKYVETSANLETNDRVLSFWKEFTHRQHKRRRVYEKGLSGPAST